VRSTNLTSKSKPIKRLGSDDAKVTPLLKKYNNTRLGSDVKYITTTNSSRHLNIINFRLLFFITVIVVIFCFLKTAKAQQSARLLLTSNIQGKSILDIENQEIKDPLLLLAQNIVKEKQKGIDLYLDLGNGFYPGIISKFSSGSIMMDFFDYFDCAATLISSRDLQIGLQNLEFLQKSRNVHLISANIKRPSGPVFQPYFLKEINGIPIAFVGLSSDRLEFDIAEKDLYNTELVDKNTVLDALIKELDTSGIHHIILVSGLKLGTTLQLMETYKQINMALCGGDYTGNLFDSNASRIDLSDGRSIVMLDEKTDYCTVDIKIEDGIILDAVHTKKALPQEIFQADYQAFCNRMILWKEKYQKEQNQRIGQIDEKEYMLDDHHLLQLMRDRFDSEIAIVEKDTINPYLIKKDISQSDLLHLVNLDYNIFTFHLSGEQVSQTVSKHAEADLLIAGLVKGDKINLQGYPIESKRQYSVVTTQSALKKMMRILGRDIKFHNSWKTVTDILTEDLATHKVTLHNDYSYLDNRFRTLIDVCLSNYVSKGSVKRGGNIETPVTQPEKSYNKWGLEDKIDLTIYNQRHRFVFTPYVYYTSQNDNYVQNLLRGTVLYEYNLSENIKPYNKFQADSVVEEIEGERPILIRETIGVSLYGNYLDGKLGLGLEKKVQDPVDDALYGFETIFSFEYPFLDHFNYTLQIDNFVSTKDPKNGQWELRSEISNTLSIQINSLLSISLKHKNFYLYENELDEEYRSSQFFTTLDLKTDWKIW
jgi:hypothetical protein